MFPYEIKGTLPENPLSSLFGFCYFKITTKTKPLYIRLLFFSLLKTIMGMVT
jgi:hypothetical protein